MEKRYIGETSVLFQRIIASFWVTQKLPQILYCNFAYLYWESYVICSIYLRKPLGHLSICISFHQPIYIYMILYIANNWPTSQPTASPAWQAHLNSIESILLAMQRVAAITIEKGNKKLIKTKKGEG